MTATMATQSTFATPEGFISRPTEPAAPIKTTVFLTSPDADAQGCCGYIVKDGARVYVPNTVRAFINAVELVDVSYEDNKYQPQQKLLLHVTTTAGQSFVFRTGARCHTASSLVIALCQLNSVALGGELEFTWVPRGACVFARVATATEHTYTSVQIPPELLGYKLSLEELEDGMRFINESICAGDSVPPMFHNLKH